VIFLYCDAVNYSCRIIAGEMHATVISPVVSSRDLHDECLFENLLRDLISPLRCSRTWRTTALLGPNSGR